MRRITLLAIAVIAIACFGLFLSCSNNVEDSMDQLVYATFDKGSTKDVSSTYKQTVSLTDINDVYWTYEATKDDFAGTTGATTEQTAVKSDYTKGLDGAIGPFSQGNWNFDVYGYTNYVTTEPTQGTEFEDWVKVADGKWYTERIYDGSAEDVELKTGTQVNPDPINVTIQLSTEEGNGTFTIGNASDFKWALSGGEVADTGSNIAMYLKITADHTTATDTTDYIKLTYSDGKYSISSGEQISWSKSSGTWTTICSIVRAKKSGSEYTDLNTYAVSPNLSVKLYRGQTTTLTANVIEENFAYGEFNGTIVGGTESTVKKTIVANTDTIFKSGVTPSSASTEEIKTDECTTVTIPSNVASFTVGSTSNLTVSATPIVDANKKFTISGSNGAVGALDLTATVTTGDTTTTVEEFKDSNNNKVDVTVTTYIAKGFTNVTLVYNGTGKDAPTLLSYDANTGKLVFTTNHFSEYLIGADEVVYVDVNNTAYSLDNFDQAIEAAKDNACTISLLKNVDLSNKYTGEDATKAASFDLTDDTLDLNGYTIHTAGPYNHGSYSTVPVCYTGNNLTIKNGNFTVGKTTDNSYALYLGTGNSGPDNAVVENITANGGINCYASEVTLKNVTSNGTNYYSVWAEHSSQVTIESGAYSVPETSVGKAVFNTDNGAECLISVNGGTITAGEGVDIAKNTVKFTTTSDAECNKNPEDKFVEKPYGFVENPTGVWKVAKTYNWKVSYNQEGYVKFDSWSNVQTAVDADSSKVYINLSFYKSANSTCINAYTPISDTTTKVGFNCTAPQVYNYGTNFFGGEAEALKCFFKHENATKAEYFKTEADADACAAQHSGATKEAT